MAWVVGVELGLCGLEGQAERLAERTCAKVAASGPDTEAGQAVELIRGRVLAVAGTLADVEKLLNKT